MRLLVLALAFSLALTALACGGDSLPSAPDEERQRSNDQQQLQNPNDGESSNGGSASLEPVGPADVNTVRIGDEVWSRTLPMTTGQCFVQSVEGLPDSGVAWGTLDGNDELSFSANYNQDGTFEAEVKSPDFYWIAGARSANPENLSIDLDFEELTIIGSGIFNNLLTGDEASGSFHFKCEE